MNLMNVVLLIFNGFLIVQSSLRMKRGLVFNGPAKVQTIMGAGFPVDLQDESVIVGLVIKAHYALPRNSTDITSPSIHYARRKRSSFHSFDPILNRWDVYKILEQYAESYGLGGKECLLRTICELAEMPIRDESSLLHEILHVLFKPSSTSLVAETPQDYLDRDYYVAEKLGRRFVGKCAQFYKACGKSYVDLFTYY